MKVMTVLGEIPVTDLGITQMHEHVLADADFTGTDPNLVHNDVDIAAEEIRYFKKAGGGTIVEQSCIGLGRDAAGLKAVSERSGVRIVASTGFYRECSYPDYVAKESADELTERMLRECCEGIDGTGVRPGIFAEIATEHGVGVMSPMEEKVFTAVAQAQTETHLPVSTHCWAGELAFEQIDVLTRNGVPPNKILIGHLGVEESVKDHVFRIADAGVYIGIDAIGYNYRQMVPMKDEGRARLVKELIDRGFLRQIAMSMDILRKLWWKHYHGIGYDYLLLRFVPMLREAGVTDEEIDTMLVQNPQEIFT